MEGLAELYTPDAVGFAMDGWPETGPFVGREAVMRQYERLHESWEHHSVEVRQTASDGDWVAVEWLWKVRGAASGIAQEVSMSGSYRISGTKIAEVRFFWTWDEALQAAGADVDGKMA